jgi:hypothetical protein
VRFLAGHHLGHFDASAGRACNMSEHVEQYRLSSRYDRALVVEGFAVDEICTAPCLLQAPHGQIQPLRDMRKCRSSTHPSSVDVFFRTMIFEYKGFLGSRTNTTSEKRLSWNWMKRLAFGFCCELEDFNRTLTPRHGGASGAESMETAEPEVDAFAFLASLDFSLKEEAVRSGSEETLAEEYMRLKSQNDEVETFRREYRLRCGVGAEGTASSFFVGKNGYMGIGPRGSQEGDRLCILAGCPTPVVLRLVQSAGTESEMPAYQLVGPCYLHGLMNGEAFAPENKQRWTPSKLFLV